MSLSIQILLTRWTLTTLTPMPMLTRMSSGERKVLCQAVYLRPHQAVALITHLPKQQQKQQLSKKKEEQRRRRRQQKSRRRM